MQSDLHMSPCHWSILMSHKSTNPLFNHNLAIKKGFDWLSQENISLISDFTQFRLLLLLYRLNVKNILWSSKLQIDHEIFQLNPSQWIPGSEITEIGFKIIKIGNPDNSVLLSELRSDRLETIQTDSVSLCFSFVRLYD